jgi:hypothetical protein
MQRQKAAAAAFLKRFGWRMPVLPAVINLKPLTDTGQPNNLAKKKTTTTKFKLIFA